MQINRTVRGKSQIVGVFRCQPHANGLASPTPQLAATSPSPFPFPFPLYPFPPLPLSLSLLSRSPAVINVKRKKRGLIKAASVRTDGSSSRVHLLPPWNVLRSFSAPHAQVDSAAAPCKSSTRKWVHKSEMDEITLFLHVIHMIYVGRGNFMEGESIADKDE